MGNPESEQERLKRLRDQQIRARDPQIKERKVGRQVAAQQRQRRKSESFIRDAFGAVSHKAKGVYIGALLGLAIMLLLPMVMEGKMANIIGIAAFPFLIALGLLIGASFDWRDDIRDHIN
ncbi:MAG: hypothetical protein ISR58_16905 [Anaerolineales bacterium]|nr:hypothetical protein [Anaerolineales bacterium]